MTATPSTGAATLTVHPDRLLPADPATRDVARNLYAVIADAPIFSPHGHVDAEILATDLPFTDPARLLVSPDHYVTRLLHARGVPLDALGVGPGADSADPREIWRAFCTHWSALAGTPSRYWLESELVEIFDVTERPTAKSADAIFDHIADRLASPAFRPRAMFERFGIQTLATTDDPLSELESHAALSEDPTFRGNVIPTFRPDSFLDPETPDWAARLDGLSGQTGRNASTFTGMLEGLWARRQHFIQHGATSTDHGVVDPDTTPISADDARRLHERALQGRLTGREAAAYRSNALFEMARMSAEDGLTMQIHAGVIRGHHRPTTRRFGADTGHDLPLPTAFTTGLRPLLGAFGNEPRLKVVLFTVDETTFSRDIAPLAGFYPTVYIGSPWWFLDAPDAILRFRAAVTETAGFTRSAGFVDDTRAFCSIPARHDMARRLDAAFLARLVVEHRLDAVEASAIIRDLTVDAPRRVFSRDPQRSN